MIKAELPYKTSLYSPGKDSTSVAFTLYSTHKDNVLYVDEPGVNQLGCMTMRSPQGPLGVDLELQLTFGGTEILAEARDKSRGENFPVSMTLYFLQD